MVYVNNSVGLTMDQSSVCEWDCHKKEVNNQEQWSYIKIAVLSPCDYDLIPKVKKPLRGKRFANKQDILTAFQREVSHVSNTHAANGIQRLPHCWQRTAETLGDYFEGV